MIEKIIFDFLTEALRPTPVYMETPDKSPQTAPSKWVLIEKTSSARSNKINTATIAIQSYAASLYEAADLNEAVKAAMLNDDGLVSLGAIFGVSLNADYNFTDTTKKKYRYQAVFDINF